MYSSRRHLYCTQNFYVARFVFGLLLLCVTGRATRGLANAKDSKLSRVSFILSLVLFFFLLPSLPLCFSLFRNYQWERSQLPNTVVPDLIGLSLKRGSERAHEAQLETKVLGSTWYTDQSPGLITLQSPEAGQHVPFETMIGIELAIKPPAPIENEKRVGDCQ
jgi:hypothetical protein